MVERTNFGKLVEVIEPPNLIEIQTASYKDFLQLNVAPGNRKGMGLQAVFKEVFPIESYDGRYVLDFLKYEFSMPKTDPCEVLREGLTYAGTLQVTFRLKEGDEVREESVYMGEIPLMTDQGSFVINGAERVIVSQLHRSPGICFEQSVHSSGSMLYSFRIILTGDRGLRFNLMPPICCGSIWIAATDAGNFWPPHSFVPWGMGRMRICCACSTRSES